MIKSEREFGLKRYKKPTIFGIDWLISVHGKVAPRMRLFMDENQTYRKFEIRNFGCTSYVQITKQIRKEKFSTRAEEGVLVCFLKGNAFCVYMPSTETVRKSQDVSFDENIVERHNDRYSQKSAIGFEIDEIET